MIFCRAYCAIFREPLLAEIDSFHDGMSREDAILNCQLVIDGLISKTKNQILTHISGTDVFVGDHQAIGVMVGIMFSEGQRMWMEKVKVNQQETSGTVIDNNDNNKSLVDSQLNETSNDVVAPRDEPVDDQYGSDNLRESIRSLKLLQSQSNIHPKELNKLINRINYLENMLLEKKSSKKKVSSRSSSNHILNMTIDTNAAVHSSLGKVTRKKIRPKKKPEPSRPVIDDNNMSEGHIDIDDFPESQQDNTSSDNNGFLTNRSDGITNMLISEFNNQQQRKKTRPTSAPHIRRPASSQVSRRLYNPVIDNHELLKEVTRRLQTPPGSPPVAKGPKVWVDNSQYTYDMRSGRRILVTEAEKIKEEMKKKREAMMNFKLVSEIDDELMGSLNNAGGEDGNKSPPAPIKPEYPGERTEKSVEEWLRKIKRLRVDGSVPSNSDAVAMDAPIELPPAKVFNAYQKLERLDLIISAEHCWNCEHHNVSLRHDPDQYCSVSDNFLRSLAQVVHECNLRIRVGVCRFPAKITPKSRPTDVDSRIGACEIQVALKDENGKVTPEILHSKLMSQRWPSKSVVEKRLRAFISKMSIPSFAGVPDMESESKEFISEGSFLPHPVGRCDWKDTPLSTSSWSFKSCNDSKINVQWVFDSRNADEQELPAFMPDSTVRLSGIEYADRCVERFELLGIIKQYRRVPDESNIYSKRIVVELFYTFEEVLVSESQCVSLQDYIPPTLRYNEDAIPIELDILLMFLKSYGLRKWSIGSESDGDYLDKSTGQLYLSRKSLFRQIRQMSWQVETLLQQKGVVVVGGLFSHPITGERGDIQLSYNEEVLDWLQDKFGKMINVTSLERLVDQKIHQAPINVNKEVQQVLPVIIDSSDRFFINNDMLDKFPIETAVLVSSYAVKRGVNVKVWLSEELNDGKMLAEEFNRKLTNLASLVGMGGEADDDRRDELEQSVHKASLRIITDLCGHSSSEKMRVDVRMFLEMCDRKIYAQRFQNEEVLNSNTEKSETVKEETVIGGNEGIVENQHSDDNKIEEIPNNEQMVTNTSPILPIEDEVVDNKASTDDKDVTLLSEPIVPVVSVSPRVDSDSKVVDTSSPKEGTTPRSTSPRVESIPHPKSPRLHEGGSQAMSKPVVSSRKVLMEPIKEVVDESKQDDKQSVYDYKSLDIDIDVISSAQSKEVDIISSSRNVSESKESIIPAEPKKPPGILKTPTPPLGSINNNNILTMKQIEEKQDKERYDIEMREEREKDSLDYQTKDLVFISIIIEGETLEHAHYDSAEILVQINGKRYPANVCLAREKGSKRRSFNVNWGEILVQADKFKTEFLFVSLVITNNDLSETYQHLPTEKRTEIGISKNSAKIPLYRFMKSYFEIKTKLLIEPEVEGKSGGVVVTIHGHAHEAKEARTVRLMSMRPKDLISLKFDPLPKDSESESDEYSDDLEDPEETEVLVGSAEGKRRSSSVDSSSLSELNKSLFPKASHSNLLSNVKK